MSASSIIPAYPEFSEIRLDMRVALDPLFKELEEGISEFTFAGVYLFRETHRYRVAQLQDGLVIFTGRDDGQDFWMSPFGLPENAVINELLFEYGSMKAASEKQACELGARGYRVSEDRDNFDYLYLTEELAKLQGRRFHRKKNLVNAFIKNYNYEGRPLLDEYIPHALKVLDQWRAARDDPADYKAAYEALERSNELVLCGGIYYVNGEPAGYSLGEETAGGKMFVIQFEKALNRFKGLYQFVNMSFAAILPDEYTYINRGQDLGNEGLRRAKLSYRPAGFVKKYRVNRNG